MRLASGFSLVAWFCTVSLVAAADRPLVVELWPGKVPDETGSIAPEKFLMSPKLDRKKVEVTEPTRMVTNVSRPTITIYRPAKDKDTGTAVLICPGGGYWNLYWQLEGEEVAAWLNSLGATGIILKYRVPRRPDEPKGVPARRPLQDAQRAVSLVRSRAKVWGIAPQRIGMIGFSAGGHLAIATATSFEKRSYEPIDDIDKISCRPDFAILLYSGYLKAKDKDELAPGLRVPAGTPPVFLAHGGADIISPPEHSVVMYLALKRAGVPVELHIYATAAHDFGVRPSDHPCSTWTQDCANWLRHQGLFNSSPAQSGTAQKRLLYVATPGIRDYLEYGGHGVLVFDIDQAHRFVKRIPFRGLGDDGRPLNVKGICASAVTGRLYVTTLKHLISFDLTNDKVLWEKSYEGGCDRMALSPDGWTIYLPSLEKEHWHVVDALTGEVRAKIVTNSGAHNTIYGPDGKSVYLAGLRSPLLSVADAKDHRVKKTVGPFSASIRPFAINGRQTLCFVNVNDLLGFEIGDLCTGKMLHRVEVQGFAKGPTKRHGCPSHGIGVTPDDKGLWLTDAFNSRMHVFDLGTMPPRQVANIPLRDQPGWITFGIDGRYAYPSTGDVIDARTRRTVAQLRDEHSRDVQSEKLLEIDFAGNRPVRAGSQFGVGQPSVGCSTSTAN